MPWKRKIPGCFGNADKKFARVAYDKDLAFDMLQDARRYGVSYPEVMDELEKYMHDLGCTPQHIRDELDHAQKMLEPWLT
jgi:hypothetical protein